MSAIISNHRSNTIISSHNTTEIEFLGEQLEIYKPLYEGILCIDNDTSFVFAFDKLIFHSYELLKDENRTNQTYINRLLERYNLVLNDNGKFECVCGKSHLIHLNIFNHTTKQRDYIIGSTCIIKIEEIIELIEKNKAKYELELIENRMTESIEYNKKILELKKEMDTINNIKDKIEVMKKKLDEIKRNKCMRCFVLLPKKSKFKLQQYICKDCHTYEEPYVYVKCDGCLKCNIKIKIKPEKEQRFKKKYVRERDNKCDECLKIDDFIQKGLYNCICKECGLDFENTKLLTEKPEFCGDTCRQINENKIKGIYNLVCEECEEEYINTRPFKTSKCYSCFLEFSSNNEKLYLKVPYERKDEAKTKGTRWDGKKKLWYIYSDNEHKDELLELFSNN